MTLRRVGLATVLATGVTLGVSAGRASADIVDFVCDAFVVASDGTIDPNPIRTGTTGFFTVATVLAPPQVAAGETFEIVVPAESLGLADAGEFPITEQRDFVHTFAVTGGTIVPGSAVVDSSAGASISTTDTTFSIEFPVAVPGGDVITFPEASVSLMATAGAQNVTVSLASFQNTIEVITPEGAVAVRSDCEPVPNQLAVTIVGRLADTGTTTPVIVLLAAALTSLGVGALVVQRRYR